MMNVLDYIKLAINYSGVGKYIAQLNKISVSEYADCFKSDIIRIAIIGVVPNEYSAITLFFILGIFISGNGGFPKGGSLKMALRMEAKYKSLDGKVKYNSKVSRFIIENGVAKGIELEGGEIIYGDYVISSVDANMLMSKLLENKYQDKIFLPKVVQL